MRKLLAAAGAILSASLIYFLLAPAFRGQAIVQPTFSVGGLALHYYGLVVGAAILSAYFVSRANSWRFGISKADIDRFAFWAVICAFVSARLYYVAFAYSDFSGPADAFAFWRGGLSIFGGIIGGALFTYFYARGKAYTHWQLLDVGALGLPLAQAIGRFGNFFNYEAYGTETALPWKMFVPRTGLFHHPTFLYEAVASLVIFTALFSFKGRLKPGNLALAYACSYGLVRFALEFIRADQFTMGQWRVNQIVAFLVFFASGAMLWYRTKPRR
jgi:phosphatidylglycerol:prolipoprotein diacylglycerol transferase